MRLGKSKMCYAAAAVVAKGNLVTAALGVVDKCWSAYDWACRAVVYQYSKLRSLTLTEVPSSLVPWEQGLHGHAAQGGRYLKQS